MIYRTIVAPLPSLRKIFDVTKGTTRKRAERQRTFFAGHRAGSGGMAAEPVRVNAVRCDKPVSPLAYSACLPHPTPLRSVQPLRSAFSANLKPNGTPLSPSPLLVLPNPFDRSISTFVLHRRNAPSPGLLAGLRNAHGPLSPRRTNSSGELPRFDVDDETTTERVYSRVARGSGAWMVPEGPLHTCTLGGDESSLNFAPEFSAAVHTQTSSRTSIGSLSFGVYVKALPIPGNRESG